jgi:hypothetical protein
MKRPTATSIARAARDMNCRIRCRIDKHVILPRRVAV